MVFASEESRARPINNSLRQKSSAMLRQTSAELKPLMWYHEAARSVRCDESFDPRIKLHRVNLNLFFYSIIYSNVGLLRTAIFVNWAVECVLSMRTSFLLRNISTALQSDSSFFARMNSAVQQRQVASYSPYIWLLRTSRKNSPTLSATQWIKEVMFTVENNKKIL